MAEKAEKRDAEKKDGEKKGGKKFALENALSQIEKKYGKGAIMKLGENAAMNVEVIPTGSIALDMALGIGGIPRGRVIEIFGQESAGKTTLALHCVAQAQKNGGTAAFIDVEHALDPTYAAALGVDVESLLVSQPDSGEQALEITEALARSGAVDLVVVDSVSALVSIQEIAGDMGAAHMALQARLMSQALRKLSGTLSKGNCSALFINQLRENISGWGPREVTSGGRALKYYSSVRIEVKKGAEIMAGSTQVGISSKVKISKNKLAPPFRELVVNIIFGIGISREAELVDLGVIHGIVDKAGSWFSYGETRLGQGKENARVFLVDHPDVADEIESKLREMMRTKGSLTAVDLSETTLSDVTEEEGEGAAEAQTSVGGRRSSLSKRIDISAEDFE